MHERMHRHHPLVQVESEVQQSPALYIRQPHTSRKRILKAATRAALEAAASSSARAVAVGSGTCLHVSMVDALSGFTAPIATGTPASSPLLRAQSAP